jgi:hypothetical protein
MPRAVARRIAEPRLFALGVVAAFCAVGCNERALDRTKRGDAGVWPAGLTAEQAALVVAKVGDRAITLGDYAATLERMDQFDRLRYQSPERRRELLEEIIDVELLAQMRGRKSSTSGETQQAIRQVLRDALLVEARRGFRRRRTSPGGNPRLLRNASRRFP